MELFDRIQHPDSLINRIQDKLIRVINAIARKPVVDGQLLKDVTVLVTSATRVEHKLGRKPRGFILTSGAYATVIETQAADEEFLYLQSSGGANYVGGLWVF